LLSAVEKWSIEQGMTEICGPLGFNDLDREGLLIDGFEENSTFEEQYNYPYYSELLEKKGYLRDVDWVEYELRMPEKRNEMLSRVAKRTMELHKLHIADTSLPKRKYIEKYRDGFFECLDVCYRDLYGTVPISKEAQNELVEQFMLIVNKEYAVFICDESERVVGFGLCFPAIGDAVKKSGGRLTLPTLLKIMRSVRNPETIDLGLVAIRPEYQNAGINAVILDGMLEILERGKVKKCETNLNLESNTAVQAQWKYFNARLHKRRRSYKKKLEDDYA
jgi:GNAT superfamily N-acetyltransferase